MLQFLEKVAYNLMIKNIFSRNYLISLVCVAVLSSCANSNIEFSDPTKSFRLYQKRNKIENAIIDRYNRDRSEDYNMPIPQMPIMSSYEPVPKQKFVSKELVTVNVTEDVHVKDLVLELAKLTSVDIEIDPRINASIILSIKDRPVSEIFERIAKLANLRYTVENDIVRFAIDEPYTKTYNVSFLNLTKNSTASSGFGQVNDEISGGISGGGSIASTSEWSLWKDLQNGIQSILSDQQQPQGSNFGNNNLNNLNRLNNQNINDGNNNFDPNNPQDGQVNVQEPIENRPIGNTIFNINQQAGVITVKANSVKHAQVEEYLNNVKKYATAQVLVEVKLVEVQLKDEFAAGIDFSGEEGSFSFAKSGNTSLSSLDTTSSLTNPFTLNVTDKLTSAVSLLSAFGTTKTISSPRLNIVNNQQAVLSFAQNSVYFEVQPEIQNQQVTAGAVTNAAIPIVVNSIAKTIPVGVILTLQASINPDTDEITMSVKPSISKISSSVVDPASTFLAEYIKNTSASGASSSTADFTNRVPIIEKKELDSVLKIRSGDIMVIGGFTDEISQTSEEGIPFLMDVPVIGNLFKKQVQLSKSVETVIFIKATIIPPGSGLMKKDADLYGMSNMG